MTITHLTPELADQPLDVDQMGVKFKGLAESYKYVDEEKSTIHPASSISDSVMESPYDFQEDLRETHERLTEGIDHPVLIWTRSNANVELDGVFKSVPTLFDPTDKERSFEDFTDGLSQVAKSKDSEKARREIESFGLEGKVRLHGLAQIGGRQIRTDEIPIGIRCKPVLSPIAVCGMTFYAYSHSAFNPDCAEIKFGFGLGEGIVEGDNNLVVVNRETDRYVVNLQRDPGIHVSPEWVQKRLHYFDPEDRTVKIASLTDFGIESRLPLGISGTFNHIRIDFLTELVKRISEAEGHAIKIELYADQVFHNEYAPFQIIQKDQYSLPTIDTSYQFHTPDDVRLVLDGTGISKGPVDLYLDIVVLNQDYFQSKRGEDPLDGVLTEDHAILAQTSNPWDSPLTYSTTRSVFETNKMGIHDVNLLQRKVYNGVLDLFLRLGASEVEKLTSLAPDETHQYHSVYRNCRLQCNGQEAKLIVR
ncbi:MAG: hypothetical protein V1740_04470 [Candidatus Woesearchaeota archaeon]